MKHSQWLILYDICDPKRLQSVGKIVSRYGERIQKSVFEANTNDIIINALQQRLEEAAGENDFIAIIPLCERDWQKAEKYGIMGSRNCTGLNYEIL
jgi:CRISPR-associated endonuclease Cas2